MLFHPLSMISLLFFIDTDVAPDADYPRAVIFDLVCRLPEHTDNKQLDADDFHNISVVEFPTYTYVGKIIFFDAQLDCFVLS